MDERPVILVVEDEPDAATMLEFQLRRQGYRVRCAADGQEALNAVFESQPDLVVLDLMLPKLDGFEVCRMMKISPHSRHIRVILLTARTAVADKLRAFNLGADDYITKPFSIHELLARVKMLLQRPSEC
jgi:DNA-binding response OmpR family regulator